MGFYEWMVSGSIACLIILGVAHSFYGERLLIGPLLKHRGNRRLEQPFFRMILRFAWHITSIAWLVLAYILYAMAFTDNRLEDAILGSVGLSFLAIGIYDLFASRGKHIGWPFLTLVGVFALLARFNLTVI